MGQRIIEIKNYSFYLYTSKATVKEYILVLKSFLLAFNP